MEGLLKVLCDVVWGIFQIATFCQRVSLRQGSEEPRSHADMLKRLWRWWCKQSQRDIVLDNLNEARLFEEWEAAASSLDRIMDYDLWYASLLVTWQTIHYT
jgi:hypothetical protein